MNIKLLNKATVEFNPEDGAFEIAIEWVELDNHGNPTTTKSQIANRIAFCIDEVGSVLAEYCD